VDGHDCTAARRGARPSAVTNKARKFFNVVKLPTEPPAEFPYIEPSPAPEFFCVDLARVHVHGPFTRLTFTVPDMPDNLPSGPSGPQLQNVAVLKMVIPTEALAVIYAEIGKKLVPPAPEGG
jgi:hypothetical protein